MDLAAVLADVHGLTFLYIWLAKSGKPAPTRLRTRMTPASADAEYVW